MFIKTLVASLFLFSATAFAGPVNINTADAATLSAELAGVGPSRAAAIVKYREEHGDFKSIEDLLKVSGIGKSILENNADNIRLSDPGDGA